jgi:hypothetical protein
VRLFQADGFLAARINTAANGGGPVSDRDGGTSEYFTGKAHSNRFIRTYPLCNRNTLSPFPLIDAYYLFSFAFLLIQYVPNRPTPTHHFPSRTGSPPLFPCGEGEKGYLKYPKSLSGVAGIEGKDRKGC